MQSSIGPLAGLSVLIIEDEFLIAVEAQRIVEEVGATEVHLASTVEDARRRLASGQPVDVAVLDIRLGDQDGAALVQDLAARNIPFVIATGLALGAGNTPKTAAFVLVKPYRDAELVGAILSALGKGRQERARDCRTEA